MVLYDHVGRVILAAVSWAQAQSPGLHTNTAFYHTLVICQAQMLMTPSSRWLSEISLTYPSLTLCHLANWHSLEADHPNPGNPIKT